MGLSNGRFYFFDADTKKELADNPNNGVVFDGTGPFVDQKAANAPNAGPYCKRRTIVTCAFYEGREYKTRDITIADFPGKTRVLVKAWFPNPRLSSTFLLISEGAYK